MSLPSPARSPLLSRQWWKTPVNLWGRSLPLRVIASVFVASVLVLVLGGFLLMQQATQGVMEGKKESVRNESRQALFAAQQQLNAADPTGGANVDKLLTDLAFGYANRTGGTDQFEVIIIADGQTITAGRADVASVPDVLRQQVQGSTDLYLTPTEVVYRDGSASVPGLISGSQLTLPGTGTYEIFFVFPLNQEVDTLRFLRSAAGTTGAVLVILLTFIAALVARQVVTPVREARLAAESLASGNLDDRMEVRSQDDLGRLATSMNYMAEELQKQITTLEDLSRVQQTFVSDVSHELRTPLTTVRMAAEVLYESRDEFDPVSARSAELLQNELDRFEALLGDLLEISRFDAGAAVLAPAKVDLVEIVRQVVDDHAHFAARARNRGRHPLAGSVRGGGGCSADRADPAQSAGERDRARRGEADRHPDRGRRRRGRDRGPRSRGRLRGRPGAAGVPPVLAGRPGPGPDDGRHGAGTGHRDGGRQSAQRLADRLGPSRARCPVPADRASQGGRHPPAVAATAGPSRHRRAERPAGRDRDAAARSARPLGDPGRPLGDPGRPVRDPGRPVRDSARRARCQG